MTRALAGFAVLLAAALAVVGTALPQQDDPAPETQRIIVAKHKLPRGHRLTKPDLRWVDWPSATLPEGAFTSVEALFGKDGDEVRIALGTIGAGEPVLRTQLTGSGAARRLAEQIPEGMRAVTVPTGDTGGGPRIQPGDRVDVILTKTEDGALLSKVIMQDVPVIAVDRDLGNERARTGGSRATIEVTRMQAQQLLLAQRVGELMLMLRGVHDSVGSEDGASSFGPEVRGRRGTFLGSGQRKYSPETIREMRQRRHQFDSDCFGVCNPCEWLMRISPPSPYGRHYDAARRGCAETPGGFPRNETSPDILERQRRRLEEEQGRVAEELRRREEQSANEQD